MMLTATSPAFKADPEAVFAFFLGMEENYRRWHPDHIEFRWVDPAALRPGVRFFFAERIDGKVLKKTLAFTRIEPGRLIEFAPTFRLMRLFLPRIGFTIEPAADGITVRQDILLRIGPLAARLNRRELDAVRRHMREEGESIARLLGA